MSGRTPVLAVLLWLMALGISVQAVLAGTFISGVANLRFTHMVVGSLLPYAALPVGILGLVRWRRGDVSAGFGIAMAMVPVLIWVQMALGHVPFGWSTAIHVPLGAALLAYTVVLAVLAGSTRHQRQGDDAHGRPSHAIGPR